MGKHEDLMALNGLYTELVKLQGGDMDQAKLDKVKKKNSKFSEEERERRETDVRSIPRNTFY